MRPNAYQPFIKEYGDPKGVPLIVFHGFPGSHVQGSIFAPHAEKFNLRILSPDRPGYGYSDPLPGKGLNDFLDGLEYGLDKLGVDKYYLVGVSGGNPSAVSLAARRSERVLGLGSVCGMAPYREAKDHFFKFARTGFDFASKTPEFLMRPIINSVFKVGNPKARMSEMVLKLNEVDQAVLKREGVQDAMWESLALARRQGPSGIIFDLKAYTAPWPMRWSQIKCPYFIWHGQQDRILSHTMAEYVHGQVKHSKLKLYPNDGHYSLPIDRAGEILADLTGA